MSEWWLLAGFFLLIAIALGFALYPLRKSLSSMLVIMPIIIAIASLAYWRWGAWDDWHQFLAKQINQQKIKTALATAGTREQIIDKLKQQLKHTPASARGWYLLGRIYASQNEWQNAYRAFEKAHRLKPHDSQITVNYAQSLWQLNHQQFNDEVRGLFQSVLKNDINQADALAMLAMDAYQAHQFQQAIDYWQRLLKIAPPQSPDERAIRKAIIKAQQQL